MLSRLVVHLQGNYSHLQRSLQSARGMVASTTAGISAAAGGVARLGAAIGALGAVAAAGKGISMGVQMAAQAEQAQVAFQTLLGSSTAAAAVLSDLQSFAASTPFEFPELRDTAKNLIAFGVTTSELQSRMQMLGDIAAGTGKPIGEFAAIFGKVKATGKVGLESLNQLAERGVPIYTALASTMGVGREEMLDMISKGKVGFAELDAALQQTTSAGGMFAGGMLAQSTTLTGLWSTFTDNVGMAFQTLGQVLIDAFDFKAILAKGIAFSETAKEWFLALKPIVAQFATTAMAWFAMASDMFQSVFGGMLATAGTTFAGVGRAVLTAMAMAEFGYKNWRAVAELAMATVSLSVVQLFGTVQHFFTGQLPALLTWFGSNWRDVFRTAFDFVTTVFINLGQNIRAAMKAIWDFIASGGRKPLAIAWTPLTDGFVNSIRQMPEIADRVIGPLESQLQASVNQLGTSLGADMASMVAERLAEADQQISAAQAAPNIVAKADAPVDPETAPEGTSTAGGKQDQQVGALAKGSQAAYSAIFAAMRSKQDDKGLQFAQQTAKASVQMSKGIGQIAAAVVGAPVLAVIDSFG